MFVYREGEEEPEKEGGKRIGGGEGGGRMSSQPQKDKKDEEKKINLLLFWTDTQKYNQLLFVCPANPEIGKHKKFPFCRDVYYTDESTLKEYRNFSLSAAVEG